MRTPHHSFAHRQSSDTLIADRGAAAVTAATQTHGRSATAAHVWIETLHVRAQIRAERHLRGTPQLATTERRGQR
jgi:hypothetical protein